MEEVGKCVGVSQMEIISDRMNGIMQMSCGRKVYSIFVELKEKKASMAWILKAVVYDIVRDVVRGQAKQSLTSGVMDFDLHFKNGRMQLKGFKLWVISDCGVY